MGTRLSSQSIQIMGRLPFPSPNSQQETSCLAIHSTCWFTIDVIGSEPQIKFLLFIQDALERMKMNDRISQNTIYTWYMYQLSLLLYWNAYNYLSRYHYYDYTPVVHIEFFCMQYVIHTGDLWLAIKGLNSLIWRPFVIHVHDAGVPFQPVPLCRAQAAGEPVCLCSDWLGVGE